MMIANIALLGWPVVTLILYMLMPAGRATIWTLLGGYLLLPVVVSFDFPGLPALNKETIPSLTALLLAPIFARRGEFRWPRSRVVNTLMILVLLIPIGTALTNGEQITIGSVTLPALSWWETLSSSVGNVFFLAPFVLGAALLNNESGHRDLIWAFVAVAFLYSVPVLMEIRLSPFLLRSVYNIDNGLFTQQIRSGGFRSMVFIGHGLLISTFFAMSLIAALGMWRMKQKLFSLPMAVIFIYLLIVIVLNKSLGAIILLIGIIPVFVLLSSRRYLTVVCCAAILVMTYPMLRGANVLPLHSFNEMVRPWSSDRAESFKFRLDNEDMLLNRASQKPWFGWGRFGRSRVMILTSWGETKDVSVTDGTWVVMIGISGWLGYIAYFGLLTYPFLHAFRFRRLPLPMASLTLIAMLLLNVLDLIPNSSQKPVTWLIAGALAGMTAASMRRRPPPSSMTSAPAPAI
jgi:hypothetical protein